MSFPTWFRSGILALAVFSTVLFGAITLNAQTQKGSFMIAGAASFSSSSGDLYGDETQTQFQIMPGVYHFLADNVAVGGRINYIRVSQGDVSSSALLIGPYAAYFFQSGPKSSPFVGGGIFLNSSSSKYGDFSSTANGHTIVLSGGMALFVRPHFAIIPELGINFQELESTSGTTILLGVGLAGFIY